MEQNIDSHQIIAVRCHHCRKLHDSTARTFITIEGNVLIGSEGGILGNSDNSKQGVPKFVFCYETRIDHPLIRGISSEKPEVTNCFSSFLHRNLKR